MSKIKYTVYSRVEDKRPGIVYDGDTEDQQVQRLTRGGHTNVVWSEPELPFEPEPTVEQPTVEEVNDTEPAPEKPKKVRGSIGSPDTLPVSDETPRGTYYEI